MSITRIRVPSKWDTGGNDGVEQYGVADFQLGVGPCGKTVVELQVDLGPNACVVSQVCSCTERKVFVYPWHTVTGRVEVTYGDDGIGRDIEGR